MKKNTFLLTMILIAVGISFLGLYSIFQKIVVRYWGEQIIATVNTVPSQCDKYNYITVSVGVKNYEIAIGRMNCQNDFYKVGQQVRLYQHSNYDNLEWPESEPVWLPILLAIALFLAFISIRTKLKQ